MTELSLFNFEQSSVSVLTIEDKPWFVAKEVATILGYADPSMMLKHVDDEDKQTINPQKSGSVEMTEAFGSNTFKLSIINESGLYACIFGSHKPEAKEFKKWVTSEVLPSIRKTGSYSVQQLTPGQLLKLQAEALISVELKQQEQEQQLLKHDSRLNTIEQRFQKADEVLKQLPPATVDVPTKSVRSCINEVLRSYSYRTGDAYQSLWNVLYKEYKYRYHVDLKTRAKNEELKTLDYAEQFGVIDKVYALALELFGKD